MGLGIGLLFVLGLTSFAAFGLRRAFRIEDRWQRRRRIAIYCVVGLIGLFPVLSVLYRIFGPPPDPIATLAQIFPKPLPSGIGPIAAENDSLGDYWTVFVAIKLDPVGLEALRNARMLAPANLAGTGTIHPPKSDKTPDFWPKQNCDGMVLYENQAPFGEKMHPPRSWNEIQLYYCPKDQTAFIWAWEMD